MANTLTNLAPDLYEALDVVSRELVGFIPSVTLDSGVERAAVGQTVRSFVTPASSAADIAPGQLPPNTGDQTIGNQTITISRSRGVPVRWNGEEQRSMNTGAGYNNILRDQFAQAMRTLCNEVESDVAGLYATASRATGTAGTTPFASGVGDSAQVRKILSDNGAPLTDMQLVIDTTAGASLRTNTQLSKANEANDASLLRQGVLLDLHGMAIRESGQAASHVQGAGSGYLVAGTPAIGDTSIPVDTGTGALSAGDVITFAGDTNKYIIAADYAGGAGNITIAAPGLLTAVADNSAITSGADYSANFAFSRSAIILATRAPERPTEGDSAEDVMMVTDPRSGLSFEVSMYKEYRQVHYEVAMAWGWKNVKPEHTALLLG